MSGMGGPLVAPCRHVPSVLGSCHVPTVSTSQRAEYMSGASGVGWLARAWRISSASTERPGTWGGRVAG